MITNKHIAVLICFWVASINWGISQNTPVTIYSLDDCIKIAIKNNLELKIQELKANTSELGFNKSRASILPSLNMDYNLGMNSGRSIDPFTNNYINQELTFSSAGLNLNLTVFNGFKIKNEIKRSRFNMQASEFEIEEAKQNLILNVTLLYIQILNNTALVDLSESRLEISKSQLDRVESLYKNGAGNPADFTDMKGQYAKDQAGIIMAQNNLKIAKLNLFKILNIDLDFSNTFESINEFLSSTNYQLSANEVYHDALQNLATFKSKQLRINAAEKGVKVAKSNYFPEVTFFGQLNTNYSSNAQVFTQTGTAIIETGDYINIANQEHSVLRNDPVFKSDEINYNDQFNNNLNSVAGVSVRIPLFNGFRAKNEVALEKIQVETSIIELEQTKLNFKHSIEEAYKNMEAAYQQYHILTNQVKAYEESFRVNEVRFNNGVSNIVEYITSKNNMDTSRLNLNKSKFEYLLRIKILDYYRGI